MDIYELLNDRKSNFLPIQYQEIRSNDYRLNLVTDSLKASSLFGGVATALILAVMFCNKKSLGASYYYESRDNNPVDFEIFCIEITWRSLEKWNIIRISKA